MNCQEQPGCAILNESVSRLFMIPGMHPDMLKVLILGLEASNLPACDKCQTNCCDGYIFKLVEKIHENLEEFGKIMMPPTSQSNDQFNF